MAANLRVQTTEPFSCKRRGLCPSCNARRIAETAAHLVDSVIPPPVRQWVFSVPKHLRRYLERSLNRRVHYHSCVINGVFEPVEDAADVTEAVHLGRVLWRVRFF